MGTKRDFASGEILYRELAVLKRRETHFLAVIDRTHRDHGSGLCRSIVYFHTAMNHAEVRAEVQIDGDFRFVHDRGRLHESPADDALQRPRRQAGAGALDGEVVAGNQVSGLEFACRRQRLARDIPHVALNVEHALLAPAEHLEGTASESNIRLECRWVE